MKKAAATVFWKTTASKTYKSSHQVVFSKIFLQVVTDSMKFTQNPWEISVGVYL